MLRKAKISDLRRISEIEINSFKNPWSKKALKEAILDEERVDVYVLYDNNDVVAYMSYMKIFDEVHINNIAVDKKYRGKKYGRMLVSGVIDRLKEFSITLEVREDNFKAINLYKSLDFKTEGIRKDYYGRGQNGLIMWIRR